MNSDGTPLTPFQLLMQKLASATGTHVGKWGTPEYGVTEGLSDTRNAEGGSVLGDATVQEMNGSNFKTADQILAERNAGTLITPGNPTGTWPVSTGGGSTGGGSTGGSTGGNLDTSSAEAIYGANMQRIRDLFANTKQSADNYMNQGRSTFDNLMKSIGAFRDRAGVLRDNAGQEIVNTASDILGSTARGGREAMGQSRALGRAMGLGDSSKFNNQNKVLASTLGSAGSVLANKGENVRANNDVFQGRMDQAQTQEGDANSFLKGVTDKYGEIMDAGTRDFGGNVNEAGANFNSLVEGLRSRQEQLNAINPVNAKGLTQYSPTTSGIMNTIAPTMASMRSGTGVSSTESGANPYQDTNYLNYLKKRAGTYTG